MLKITNPETPKEIKIEPCDWPESLDWNQANEVIQELGGEMRLPTIKELKAMYEQLHQNGKGNFEAADYWSREEYDEENACYFSFDENDAYDHVIDKSFPMCVRFVKDL